MNRSHRWLIAAGACVLALTNAVVLVGVASNRRQPPDSVLELTQRELGTQWSWMWRDDENSGLSLRLEYRFETARDSGLSYGAFGPPAWLDRDKLASLGFDVMRPPSADADTHYDRMLGRDVLLVLELDGPAYARALQAARDRLGHRENEHDAQEDLKREEQEASRLFIVDAGLDQTALRQRYPDRAHYAIVKGTIRPYVRRDRTSAKLYGSVTAVHCETINVPLQFRGTVAKPFVLDVAFGSRLEPWIISAGRRGAL